MYIDLKYSTALPGFPLPIDFRLYVSILNTLQIIQQTEVDNRKGVCSGQSAKKHLQYFFYIIFCNFPFHPFLHSFLNFPYHQYTFALLFIGKTLQPRTDFTTKRH